MPPGKQGEGHRVALQSGQPSASRRPSHTKRSTGIEESVLGMPGNQLAAAESEKPVRNTGCEQHGHPTRIDSNLLNS
jgi:hypothetical protein